MKRNRHYVPLTWARNGIEAGVASRAWEAALVAVAALPDVFTLSLRLSAGGGQPVEAGIIVEAGDPDHARDLATRVANIITGFAPFIGLAPDAGGPPPRDQVGRAVSLVACEGPARSTVFNTSAAWTVAARCANRVALEVSLHDVDDLINEGSAETVCSIRLRGDADDVHMVATMMAIEAAGPARLEVSPDAGSLTMLPLPMLAHIMGTVCRLGDELPSTRLDHPGDIHALFDNEVHGLALGPSGSGKSIFLLWRVKRGVERGRQQIIFAIEPQFASDAAAILSQSGTEFDCLDFGAEEPPRLNLCQPPSWVRAEDHISDLCSTIVSTHQGQLTYEMHGPVGQKLLRALATPLVLDSRQKHPISCIDDLASSGPVPAWVDAMLDRITDPAVVRRFKDARQTITMDREAHIGMWVASKIEPLLANSHLRGIIDAREGNVALERLRDGRSLLVVLPEAQLGRAGCKVLASILLHQFRHLLKHAAWGEAPAIDLILDEAQFFPYEALRDIYTTDRKLGVNLICSSQTLAQFDAETRACIVGNSGALGVFRLGKFDAELLADRYRRFSEGGLQRLSRYHMAATNSETDLHALMDPKPECPSGHEALTAAHQRTRHDTTPLQRPRASASAERETPRRGAIDREPTRLKRIGDATGQAQVDPIHAPTRQSTDIDTEVEAEK